MCAAFATREKKSQLFASETAFWEATYAAHLARFPYDSEGAKRVAKAAVEARRELAGE